MSSGAETAGPAECDVRRISELVEVFTCDAGLTSLWRTLPYGERLALALNKMRLLPDAERRVFANWCMWHDPRVGFVLHTNLAATLPPEAATMRDELLCDAASCLAAVEQYDEAWAFAREKLGRDDVMVRVPRAALLLADVAQARQDTANEVAYAQAYWDACKNSTAMSPNRTTSTDAAIRYVIALCHAKDMQRAREFATRMLASEEGRVAHARRFFTSVRDNATEVLESTAEWSVRYKTRCWPARTDMQDWPAD